ncbi:MAG: hypothetical protein A3D92_07945 [Bacteroidetes bacterium RIFCSPHIGHO2_02_FULL_44_7]|nr:MAG: hypothetical protein A3D92_07945 [Bacteroidetes bacterium RIFCSPHIGHO2_02_FULL_44_7]
MTKSFSLILFLIALSVAPFIDRLGFYRAFESSSASQMDSELKNLKSAKANTTRDAYIGALIMKKSQFMATPKEKVEKFKEGAALLEAAIRSEPSNSEFRFLRFAIQENVPKIVKYSSNIEEDKAVIVKSYKHMDPTLKKVVRSYANASKNLSPGELN